ncbi:class C sortase [Atopobium fossor]|uniref:class C sortase n=1 Tax=Atopobium fossor TaxID=39487 RepID=UPI000429A01F|nr:class C sortase [Atopobium fossor]
MIQRNTYTVSQQGREGNSAPSLLSYVCKESVRIVFAALLVFGGLALIAYPFVSSWLNQLEQQKVAKAQQELVQSTPTEDLSSELKAAQDYNARLLVNNTKVIDPFAKQIQSGSDEEYKSLLNIADNGMMGELIIPKISVDFPIYHYVDGENMNHGVGHMPMTSLPVGGLSTHCVLAGHTGLPSARVLDDLNQLEEGDFFVIRVLNEEYGYKVYKTEVVLPTDVSSLTIAEGDDIVTLVTCTPYGVNSHRLLVHARRFDLPQDWNRETKALPFISSIPTGATTILIPVLIGLAVIAGIAAGLYFSRRKKQYTMYNVPRDTSSWKKR